VAFTLTRRRLWTEVNGGLRHDGATPARGWRGDDTVLGEGSSSATSKRRRRGRGRRLVSVALEWHGSAVTCAGRRRRGERRQKGVGAAAGGTVKGGSTVTLPAKGGVRPSGKAAWRSDTRGPKAGRVAAASDRCCQKGHGAVDAFMAWARGSAAPASQSRHGALRLSR
jgi:hypothetical protein